MNFDNILNQVLGAVKNVAGDSLSNNSTLNDIFNSVKNVANEQLSGNSTSNTIAKVGGGAAIAGVLSMILGRNGGGNLAKLGSLAALGSLAYQAYQNYQNQQGNAPAVSQQEFEQPAQDSGVALLKTMIAAAAADGAITEEEKAQIAAEAGDNAELQQWIANELTQPATPAEIAQLVNGNQALASQVYLAARVVCKELDRKEIVFLSQLAAALGLDDSLVEQLEKQAGF